MEKLKQEYAKIKAKFNLPHFEDIDRDFELGRIDIEKTSLLVKEILRMVLSRLSYFINYLEPIVNTQPQSMHAMIEISNLSDEDKKEVFVFYKRLYALFHEGLAVEIETEKECSQYILKVWKQWPEIKNKERHFLKKIKEAWLKEEKDEESGNYMN